MILQSNDQLTRLANQRNCHNWQQLLDYVRKIPYGRNEIRTDFSLVLSNHKGTCSSKHALLKKIADSNGIPNVLLILAIYKMDNVNTPGIGNHMAHTNIEYIPEAHCYLKINGERLDLTSETSDIKRIEEAIILEEYIRPEQVGDYKVDFHKSFLKEWLVDSDNSMTLDQLWRVREKCIKELSVSAT